MAPTRDYVFIRASRSTSWAGATGTIDDGELPVAPRTSRLIRGEEGASLRWRGSRSETSSSTYGGGDHTTRGDRGDVRATAGGADARARHIRYPDEHGQPLPRWHHQISLWFLEVLGLAPEDRSILRQDLAPRRERIPLYDTRRGYSTAWCISR